MQKSNKTSINHFYTHHKHIKNNNIVLITTMQTKNKLQNSPSRKEVSPQPLADRSSQSDPLHAINITEQLRKEATQARRESDSKDAEIVRLKSQIRRLQSNQSCKAMIDQLNSGRQSAEVTRRQDLTGLENKMRQEFQKLKKQSQAKKMEQLVFPTDSFIQRQSSNSAVLEVKNLKDQVKLLTEANKQLLERLSESKSGSQASRTLEAEFADLRSKLNGYERQLAEKDNANRTLTDEISSLRKKTTSFDSEMAAKKDAIKKLSASIKRLLTILQPIAPNDRRMANPAKTISEGAEIEASKLPEYEKYATSVLQSFKETINKYSSAEATNAVEIARLNDHIEALQLQKNRKDGQLKQEQAKSFSLTNKVAGLQDRLKQESGLRTAAQTANAKLSSTISEQKTTITACQNKNKTLTTSNEQLQRQKKQNLSKIKTQSDKLDDLQRQVKRLKAEVLKIQGDLEKKTNQYERAKTTIANLEGDKKVLSADLTKTKNDLTTANETIRTKNSRVGVLEQSERKLKDEVRILKDEVKRLEAELKEANRRLANAESDISSLNYNLNKEKDDHKRSLGVIDNINKMMVGEASQHFTGKTKLLQRTRPNESHKLKEEIQGLINEWVSSFRAVQFFNGSSIIPRESVSWMVDTLRGYMKEVPTATRLVHRFDPLNATNFHQYIDGIPNLLVLVHLSNGAKIGGFTAYPVQKDHIQEPGKGFIFSITDSKAYYMRKDPRKAVVNYDEYYLILGNADVRLRQQKIEQKQKAFVFSSFGIASSTFDNEGDSRTKFLKISENTNNDQPVESFEFYEVIFER